MKPLFSLNLTGLVVRPNSGVVQGFVLVTEKKRRTSCQVNMIKQKLNILETLNIEAE